MKRMISACAAALFGVVAAWAGVKPDWKAETQPDTIIGYYTVKDSQSKTSVEADGSLLAAFAEDGVCRGVAAIGQGPKGMLFQIPVGIASSNDKNISFKVWDAATGEEHDIIEKIDSVAGIEKVGGIASPVTLTYASTVPETAVFAVIFDLGEHGTRTGGGELEQQVENGKSAVEPIVTPVAGWEFKGWDKPSTDVCANLSVTAEYAVVRYAISYQELKDAANANPTSYTVEDVIDFAALPNVEGFTFKGWSPASVAKGTTGDLVVKALWEEVEKPEPEDPEEPVVKARKIVDGLDEIDAATFPATMYDGYLYLDSDAADRRVYGEDGDVVGTIQVKAAKAKYNKKTGKTTTKLTIGIQLATETKKISFSAEYDLGKGGEQEFHAKDGRTLMLLLGTNGLTGSFSGVSFEAVANVFLLKDAASKAAVSAADAAYVGTYNVFAEEGALSVSVASKGKAKVAGTLSDGTKISASAQLLVGDGIACAPFVLAKQGLAFAVWFGEETTVVGLTDAIVGAGTDLSGTNAFYADVDELSKIVTKAGVKPLSEFMPNGVTVTSNGKKWAVANGAKAGKIKYDASSGYAWDEKSSENPAGLSLSYSSKAGTFTGSFKVYGVVSGKLKTHTAKVAGVLVDGQGYGYATIAKIGSVRIRIVSEAHVVVGDEGN